MDPVQAVLDSEGRPVNSARYGSQPAWKQRVPAIRYMSQMPPRPLLGGSACYQQPNFQAFQPSHKIHDDSCLDDYDLALLAEPHHDRQWQAAHGINRLSLPVRPTMATAYSNTLHDPFTEDSPYYGTASALDYSSSFLQNSPLSTRNPSGILDNSVPRISHISSSPPPISSSPSYQVGRRKTIPRNQIAHHNANKVPYIPNQPSFFGSNHVKPQLHGTAVNRVPPVVQGIRLVSPNELPDRFRSIFSYQVFNAVQSKCFQSIYKSNDNLVLSAPTGSGKTVVMELAICRLVSELRSGQFKIVYMAPTKSLCAERQADWQIKFKHLDLECAELTGDTNQAQHRNVQKASIIITTPEKWDSMTRRWKDHIKLVQLVKLFLIDEVHILKESRGATLEAVVSRMKSVGSDIRFVALSATVPNFEEVAIWLGKDQNNQDLPAQCERFGEEFRPVRLQKFVYGLPFKGNDFAFDAVCDKKLPEIIEKHSNQKPIMVFCCTRKATMITAKVLAESWATKDPRDRDWPAPSSIPPVLDSELKYTLNSGVAFHHAGLDGYDRQAVEKGFLEGRVSVICCTSTLAVGVNLPCHLVIVKNTVSWQDEGLKEYADLEMMQMLGRAGRPQFGSTATAVIITKQEKVEKYEKLVSGAEVLESCLHLNLIDHLNAEIGLGTINDLCTAKRWLAGTFLYVRLGQNPKHYKLDGDVAERSLDERIAQICDRDIRLLQETQLVTMGQKLKSTEFGSAMARYYVKFETMSVFLSLPPRAKMSEILSVLAEAEEFHEVRFRSGEKSLYKHLNSAGGIKFPIKVDIAIAAQKRSIIIQAELGGVEYPTDEQYGKHRKQHQQDKAILFTHAHRLIRCIIDCQIHLQDGPATRHALELARSLSAKVWDNSPLQMKQVPSLGPVSVRKLVTAGINSLETLEATEAHRINTILSKPPGFGEKILAVLQNFPKLRVSVKMMGKALKAGKPPVVKMKAEVGFMNEKAPFAFDKKLVYICFLAESAKQLGGGEDVFLSAELQKEGQYIVCYVMCDEMAGTLRYAELKPQIPPSAFPFISTTSPTTGLRVSRATQDVDVSKGAKEIVTSTGDYTARLEHDDEFPDDDIDDRDLIAAANELDFTDVDTFDFKRQQVATTESIKAPKDIQEHEWEPQRIENGKWSCNHKCKDKSMCKHLCCREGLDKVPKAPKCAKQFTDPKATGNTVSVAAPKWSTNTTSNVPLKAVGNKSNHSRIEVLDLASKGQVEERLDHGRRGSTDLYRLYSSTSKRSPQLPCISDNLQAETLNEKQLQQPLASTTDVGNSFRDETPDDFEASWMEDLPSPSATASELKREPYKPRQEIIHGRREQGGENCSLPSTGLQCHEKYSQVNNSKDPLFASNSYGDQEENMNYHGPDHGTSLYSATQHLDHFSNPTQPKEMSVSKERGTEAGHQHLFLPTSSPAKMPIVFEDPDKLVQEAKDTSMEPPRKRQRLDDHDMSQQLLDRFLHDKSHTERLEKLRKRLPWDDIEGIDLEFFLDYADFVDFV